MSNTALFEALTNTFTTAEIQRDEPMARHTTFKVGGPADFMVQPTSASEVDAAIAAAKLAGEPWWIIGCGSDLLVSDDGLRGVVIKIGDRMANISIEGTRVRVQAGATNEAVAEAACAAGLAGYEFASGIPGSIGGAAIMNAGAYEGEFKDVARAVTCLHGQGNIRTLSAEDADWGYRHSMMGDEGLIVLEVELELHNDDPAAIRARMDDLAQRRSSKQPLEMASAGSTFKRPTGYFAGKLIQDSGMQGHRVGGAQVSTKHAGFVVNTGTATAADVLQVIRDVQAAVREQFGVELEPEVKMWGF
ncbi:MAG: UDP-N-acetylmuramate dehydrogenase [Eggerthellaceae bacterium]